MPHTQHGDTVDARTLVDIMRHKGRGEMPVLIRVIERPVQVSWLDDPDMTPMEKLETLTPIAPSEYRTFTLDPDDIELVDGVFYLLVGDQEE